MKNRLFYGICALMIGVSIGCGKVAKKTADNTNKPTPPTKPTESPTPPQQPTPAAFGVSAGKSEIDSVAFAYDVGKENVFFTTNVEANSADLKKLSVASTFRAFTPKEEDKGKNPSAITTISKVKDLAEGGDETKASTTVAVTGKDNKGEIKSALKPVEGGFFLGVASGDISPFLPMSTNMTKDTTLQAKYLIADDLRFPVLAPAFAVASKQGDADPDAEALKVKITINNKKAGKLDAKIWASKAEDSKVQKPTKKGCYIVAALKDKDQKDFKVVLTGIVLNSVIDLTGDAVNVAKLPEGSGIAKVFCDAYYTDEKLTTTGKFRAHVITTSVTTVAGGFEVVSKAD